MEHTIMTEPLDTSTVGEIVATNYHAAAVFEQFGIDFCCGGRRSLDEACREVDANPAAVAQALRAIPAAGDDGDDVTRWPLDRLVDHIVERHHTYVRSRVPVIERHLAKLVTVHGAQHHELARVLSVFDRMGRDLFQHMVKEERVLFPYIRELASLPAGSRPPSPFGTIENPIRMMEREHREAGDELRLIRELTKAYVAPADGCTTYRVCFEELAQFERDLHRHVHLENNVLFPKAVELEQGSGSWRS
jgi:regulator of cell morphogenesis and NO signaling